MFGILGNRPGCQTPELVLEQPRRSSGIFFVFFRGWWTLFFLLPLENPNGRYFVVKVFLKERGGGR